MTVYSSLFSDPEAAEFLSDRALVQAMLDVEVALAEAQADVGLIPRDAVEAIRTAASIEHIDLVVLAHEAAAAGNLAIPLVRQLTERVRHVRPASSDYVHLGATSQDVIDTALVLQLKAVVPLILGNAKRAADACARLAERYRTTPMAGRTWLQQATPITVGVKAAGWLAALERGSLAVRERSETALVLQFGGASGTLAALGSHAQPIAAALGKLLGIPVPAMPWHSHRDSLLRLACAVAVLVGTLGKIGKDIALLAQTEVGEVVEANASDRGRSSSMPHKHNPVGPAIALAASLRVPALLATLLSSMPQEHERGLGGWQAEWETLPELIRLASASARSMADTLGRLHIDEERIAANLDVTRGLVMAEAIVVRLTPALGRSTARAIVDAACERATTDRTSLADALQADRRVVGTLSPDEIRETLNPENYLGQAAAFVDAALADWRRRRTEHA
jgi:3-carboxy-cis,cis-muconate cycloisomerase